MNNDEKVGNGVAGDVSACEAIERLERNGNACDCEKFPGMTHAEAVWRPTGEPLCGESILSLERVFSLVQYTVRKAVVSYFA